MTYPIKRRDAIITVWQLIADAYHQEEHSVCYLSYANVNLHIKDIDELNSLLENLTIVFTNVPCESNNSSIFTIFHVCDTIKQFVQGLENDDGIEWSSYFKTLKVLCSCEVILPYYHRTILDMLKPLHSKYHGFTRESNRFKLLHGHNGDLDAKYI